VNVSVFVMIFHLMSMSAAYAGTSGLTGLTVRIDLFQKGAPVANANVGRRGSQARLKKVREMI
jgi:hypothetical protein